jgi:hypothetical protein
VTPEGVPTHIVDFSAREYFGEEFLIKEMQRVTASQPVLESL